MTSASADPAVSSSPRELALRDRGVSLQFLIDFLKEEKIGGESVGNKRGNDIREAITLPRTNKKEISYSQYLHEKGQKDSKGNPAIGRVRFFVSHAWSYTYQTLIDSLIRWKRLAKFGDDKPLYMFLDYFVVNQNKPTEDLSRLDDMIALADSTVLVLSPWDRPTPLTRAWCVYEIWKTSLKQDEMVKRGENTDNTFEITMPEKDVQGFEHALVNNYDKMVKTISKFDIRKAEATVPTDLTMIQESIINSVGYEPVQTMVGSALRGWMGKEATDVWRDLKKTSNKTSYDFSYYLGRFWRKQQNDLNKAIETQLETERIGREMKIDEVKLADPMTERAYCMSDQDDRSGTFRSETADLKREIARIYIDKYGLKHKQTCKALHSMARSFGPADPWFSSKLNCMVMNIRKEVLGVHEDGVDQMETLNSMNELAENYLAMNRLKDALYLQTLVYDGRKVHCDERHEKSMRANRKLGITELKMGKVEQAMERLFGAWKLGKEICGPSHKGTIETLEPLIRACTAHGDMKAAKDLAEKLLTHSKKWKKPPCHHTETEMSRLIANIESKNWLKKMNLERGWGMDEMVMPVAPKGFDGKVSMESLIKLKRMATKLEAKKEEEEKEPAGGGLGPQPSAALPPRTWVGTGTPPTAGYAVTVMHWNILADKLSGLYDKPGSSKVFVHAKKEDLQWEGRQQKILDFILNKPSRPGPDIFDLCELDKFDSILKSIDYKYDGVCQLRANNKKDGSGIFWRKDKFKLEKVVKDHIYVDGKLQDQVVLMVKLNCLAAKGKSLVYVTAHLKSDKKPAGEILRVKQTQNLLERLEREFPSAGVDLPVVFGVDLNSSHVALDGGKRPLPAGAPLNDKSYRPEVYPLITSDPRFGFQSAYKAVQGKEPWATSVKIRPGKKEGTLDKFEYTIDYIFVSKNVTPTDVLRVYQPAEVPEKAFPSALYPSDHELVAAKLVI